MLIEVTNLVLKWIPLNPYQYSMKIAMELICER